jgi:hypothetical protein
MNQLFLHEYQKDWPKKNSHLHILHLSMCSSMPAKVAPEGSQLFGFATTLASGTLNVRKDLDYRRRS